jgi:hypothetical protein
MRWIFIPIGDHVGEGAWRRSDHGGGGNEHLSWLA